MRMNYEEPNFFDYAEFYDFISEQPYTIFVEVGCWLGHSVSYLAQTMRNKPNVKIYAIDLFDDSYDLKKYDYLEGIRYKLFQKKLIEAKVNDIVIPIKSVSWDGAANFSDESVDFVFIDADHSYESVKKDIEAWLPKIRKNGIISGHDYGNGNPSGVKQAVDEKFTNFELKGSCWYSKIL
jgi:predicted O-methyltransferase YrrM